MTTADQGGAVTSPPNLAGFVIGTAVAAAMLRMLTGAGDTRTGVTRSGIGWP